MNVPRENASGDVAPVATPLPPQLEYASQPSVGDLILNKVDGLSTITMQSSWRRIAVAMSPILGSMVIAAIFLAFNFFVLTKNLHWDWMFLVALMLIVGVASSAPGVVSAIYGYKWLAYATGLEFIGRGVTQVVHLKYPRFTMAGLRIERLRPKDHIIKRRALVLIQRDGTKATLVFGSAAELGFQCNVFREALGLPDDPLRESLYPAPPFLSRLRRFVLPDGVVVVFNPPKVGLDGMLLIAATIVAVSAGLHFVQQANRALVMPDLRSAYGLLLIFVISAGVSALVLHMKYRYRRATSFWWQARTLHLSERSFFTPCNVNWPAALIDDVAVERRGDAKVANLLLRLKDGTTATLLANVPHRDVKLALALIQTAIGQDCEGPLPAQ
jgi:hypothetical protein